MLTSSEAKFRCMWHMVVWSVMLMIVSQFFRLTDHIGFYIFASAAMLLLPLITSIYSNTAGRHGAGLLRVSYIFCDPVLACITVIPVLLINRLPVLVQDYVCLDRSTALAGSRLNESWSCVNSSASNSVFRRKDGAAPFMERDRPMLLDKVRLHIGLIQASLVAPSLLTLAMGRRTRKMSYATIVTVACYWLIACIETADLIGIEVVTVVMSQHHAIISAASVVAIATILTNSYAIVTLCSYICPMDRAGESAKRFDTLYRFLVGTSGFVFAEVPLLVTRGQVIATFAASTDQPHPLPMIFYIWVVKDVVFISIAVATVGVHIIGVRGQEFIGASCGRLTFDNPDVFFASEKRDAYIVRHKSLLRPNINRVVVVGNEEFSDSDDELDQHRRRHSNRHRDDKSPSPDPVVTSPTSPTKKLKKSVTFRLDSHPPVQVVEPAVVMEAVSVAPDVPTNSVSELFDEDQLREMRDSSV